MWAPSTVAAAAAAPGFRRENLDMRSALPTALVTLSRVVLIRDIADTSGETVSRPREGETPGGKNVAAAAASWHTTCHWLQLRWGRGH